MESSISNNLVYKRKKLYDYALAVLAFLMPLVVKGFPVLIISASVVGIIYFFRAYQLLGKPKKDYYLLPYNLIKDSLVNVFKERGAMMYMVLLFAVYLFSFLISDDKNIGSQKLLLKSSYLYFPLVFALTKWDREKLLRVMDFFVYGCVLQVVISLITAWISSDFGFVWAEFSYVKLSFNLHPSYAALLINVGLVFTSLRLLLNFKTNRSFKGSFWRIILIFVFTGYVVLLASKAGMLSYGVVLLFLIVYSYIYLKSKKITLGIILGLIIISGSSYSLLGYTASHRYTALKKSVIERDKIDNKPKKLSSSQKRMVLWKNSWESIKKSNFLGYGIDDGKQALQRNLKRNEEELVHSLNHNAHNQFLEILLSIGGLGLVLLLLILFYSTFGFGGFNLVSFFLLIIIALNLGLESMMEKQTGSIPIIWLLCLLASAKSMFKSVFRLT